MQEGGHNFGDFAEDRGSAQDDIGGEVESSNMPGLIRNVDSLSNLHDMAAEGPPLSPADRKRNKLGYHRTAVACGHCRRRKIRCIPAFEDPGGRCENCIRLKKDCHFFPVDQQSPVPSKRVQPATKTTKGFIHEGDVSVPSSSPGGILRSNSLERIDHAEGSSLSTPPLSRGSPGFHGFQPVSGSVPAHGFDYSQPYDSGQQQHQQGLVHSPYSPRSFAVDPMNAQFYQQYGQPLPTQYSSDFPAGPLPSNMTTLALENPYGHPTSSSNGVYPWGQPPPRSMSAGEPEELSSDFPTPYRTHTYPSFQRQMTGEIQPMPPTTVGLMPMGIESQHSSLPHNFREPTSYQPVQVEMPLNWAGGNPDQAPHLSGPVGGSYPPGWYQPQPSLTGMREEEDQLHILPSQSHQPRRSHKPG